MAGGMTKTGGMATKTGGMATKTGGMKIKTGRVTTTTRRISKPVYGAVGSLAFGDGTSGALALGSAGGKPRRKLISLIGT
jgi:hypothetical protein